jgi:hypothetical protein
MRSFGLNETCYTRSDGASLKFLTLRTEGTDIIGG